MLSGAPCKCQIVDWVGSLICPASWSHTICPFDTSPCTLGTQWTHTGRTPLHARPRPKVHDPETCKRQSFYRGEGVLHGSALDSLDMPFVDGYAQLCALIMAVICTAVSRGFSTASSQFQWTGFCSFLRACFGPWEALSTTVTSTSLDLSPMGAPVSSHFGRHVNGFSGVTMPHSQPGRYKDRRVI